MSSSARSDLHDVTVHIHIRTAKAVLVSDDGEKGNGVWMPLSQCEIEMHPGNKDIATLTAPEWLLKTKGLI